MPSVNLSSNIFSPDKNGDILESFSVTKIFLWRVCDDLCTQKQRNAMDILWGGAVARNLLF